MFYRLYNNENITHTASTHGLFSRTLRYTHAHPFFFMGQPSQQKQQNNTATHTNHHLVISIGLFEESRRPTWDGADRTELIYMYIFISKPLITQHNVCVYFANKIYVLLPLPSRQSSPCASSRKPFPILNIIFGQSKMEKHLSANYYANSTRSRTNNIRGTHYNTQHLRGRVPEWPARVLHTKTDANSHIVIIRNEYI